MSHMPPFCANRVGDAVRPARSAARRNTAIAASIFMPAIMWYDEASRSFCLMIEHVVREAGDEQQCRGDADPLGPGGAAAAEKLIDRRGPGRVRRGRDDGPDVKQAADEDDRAEDVQNARDEHEPVQCRRVAALWIVGRVGAANRS